MRGRIVHSLSNKNVSAGTSLISIPVEHLERGIYNVGVTDKNQKETIAKIIL